MADTYTFDKSSVEKLSADHDRLRYTPSGFEPQYPQQNETPEFYDWVFLTEPKTYAQSGDTGSNVYISSNPSGVSLSGGAYTTVGQAGMYFNKVRGNPYNAGVVLSPALTSHDGPLLTFTRNGYYELTAFALVKQVYADTGSRSITSTTGSGGEAHTHSITIPYGDPGLIAYRMAMWTRASSTSSFALQGKMQMWTRHPHPNCRQEANQPIHDDRQRTDILHATAGMQISLRWNGFAINSAPSGHIATIEDGSLLVRFIGGGSSTDRTLASFQSSS